MRESRVRSLAGACAVALGVTACVFNPYVKSPSPRYSGDNACKKSFSYDSNSGPDGLTYAECTRLAMEKKAGDYAVLNNGGAAFLLTLAGVAAYRAFRGGNEANVAALTTGGAVLYGAQQYLYKQPREAIYFVGAATIGCAMGVTRKRLSIRPAQLRLDLERDVPLATVDTLRTAAQASKGVRPNAQCPASRRTQWDDANKALLDATGPQGIDALQLRKRLATQRIDRLEDAFLTAQSDLVTATDQVRASVNHQLTALQPDPAEIAKSIATLKLATLHAPEIPAAEVASDDKPKPSKALPAPGGRRPPCNASQDAVDAFSSNAHRLRTQHQAAVTGIESFEARLKRHEGMEVGASEDLQKACPVGRPLGMTPFKLALAQEGVQKVAKGAKLTIPIEGGTPPFNLAAAAQPKSNTLVAVAKATEDGGYQYEITAAADAPTGIYSMIANDSAGVTRVIQVEVTDPPKG